MILIQQRSWQLPNGETWETWLVQWLDESGIPCRRPFPTFEDADAFFLTLEARQAASPKMEKKNAA